MESEKNEKVIRMEWEAKLLSHEIFFILWLGKDDLITEISVRFIYETKRMMFFGLVSNMPSRLLFFSLEAAISTFKYLNLCKILRLHFFLTSRLKRRRIFSSVIKNKNHNFHKEAY